MNMPVASRGPDLAALFESEAMPHMNDIFRAAARVLGDRGRAEDVTQEVFLQAWKSFERFEPGTNCRAWLFKILFHSISHYRRKWFKFSFVKESEELIESCVAYTAPIPEHLTDEEILAALEKLPPDYKAVVLLVDIEEFAYKEAAGILGVPIGTVMSRLSRGRKQLREHLMGVAQEYGFSSVAAEGQRA